MNSEADTCRKHVIPALQGAGWETDPHSIAEQRTITDGRIIPVGKGFVRKPPKRVDYLLRYTRDFNLAVVEAKASYKTAADGVQQDRDYAAMLDLKFAYATNGKDIIEIDLIAGTEKHVVSGCDMAVPNVLVMRAIIIAHDTYPKNASVLLCIHVWSDPYFKLQTRTWS